MSNIPELFSNSLNQSRAASIERQQFDERMRMEEEKMAGDEQFRRFQMEKMSEELRMQNSAMLQNQKYQNEQLALTRLSAARNAWTMVDPDDPVVKASQLATIGYDEYMKEAGPMAQGGPGSRFVDKDAYNRAYMLYQTMVRQNEIGTNVTAMEKLLEQASNLNPTFTSTGSHQKWEKISQAVPLQVGGSLLDVGIRLPLNVETTVAHDKRELYDPSYFESIAGLVEQMRLLATNAKTKQMGLNYETQISGIEDAFYENLMRYRQQNPEDNRFSGRVVALNNYVQKRYRDYQMQDERARAKQALDNLGAFQKLGNIMDSQLDEATKQRAYEVTQYLPGISLNPQQ